MRSLRFSLNSLSHRNATAPYFRVINFDRWSVEVSLVANPEPDQAGSILTVGQDAKGHWLVQESGGRLEGRFISFAAAMGFAQAERHARGAIVVIGTKPLVPIISFAPVETWESALRHAA